jgi:hypothetical protein
LCALEAKVDLRVLVGGLTVTGSVPPLPVLFVLCALAACAASKGHAMTTDHAAQLPQVVTWDDITRAHPRWVEAYEATSPDQAASQALASVLLGAEVTIVLATWCGDSRREVPRLMRALSLAQVMPFTLHLIDVPRGFRQDPVMQVMDILFVPTLIVCRDGQEIGRIIESSPRGIEHDLGALLRGESRGTITGHDDL